jgi:hypothetical protein
MKVPVEGMAQKRLALELRFEVDHARRYPHDRVQAIKRMIRLASENPVGIRSRHVEHNLGVERMRWLRENGVL